MTSRRLRWRHRVMTSSMTQSGHLPTMSHRRPLPWNLLHITVIFLIASLHHIYCCCRYFFSPMPVVFIYGHYSAPAMFFLLSNSVLNFGVLWKQTDRPNNINSLADFNRVWRDGTQGAHIAKGWGSMGSIEPRPSARTRKRWIKIAQNVTT